MLIHAAGASFPWPGHHQTACIRLCRCSNVLFLVGGLLLELTTNASWAAGFRDTLWYPQWFEMLAIQAVIGVSAGTGLFLTAETRKGAERMVFQVYGLQVLQVRACVKATPAQPPLAVLPAACQLTCCPAHPGSACSC